MKHIKFFRIIMICLLALFVTDEIMAQRRPVPRQRRQVDESQEKLWYGFSLGNFSFGSGFFISGKFQGGYIIEDRLSVGAHAKFFYNFVNRFGNGGSDFSLFDVGAGPTVKFKIVESFYLQGEYSYISYQFAPDNFGAKDRETFFFPLVGAGYSSGRGDWTYGLHILFIADDEVRNVTADSVEYWIDFNYNF